MFLKTHRRTDTRKGGSRRPRDTKRNIHFLEMAILTCMISASLSTVSSLTKEKISTSYRVLFFFFFGKCFIKLKKYTHKYTYIHTYKHIHTLSLLRGAGTVPRAFHKIQLIFITTWELFLSPSYR